MAVYTRQFYVADCDTCNTKLADPDDATIVATTAAAITSDAEHEGWITYRGQLCCTTCVAALAKGPHDYITNGDEPGCAICEGVPDADHTNIPQPGQLEIPRGA